MSAKIVIARVTSNLSSEILDVFNSFKDLVSQNKGNVLSNSFSSNVQRDSFTAVVSYRDPHDAESIFSHEIPNTEVRVIDTSIDGEHDITSEVLGLKK